MADTFHPPQGPCYRDLAGKTALVTGGGSGIGLGISQRLAAEGMRVFLCGRRVEVIEEAAESIRTAGGWAQAVATDVSQEAGVARLMATVGEAGNGLQVLVHNAALVRGGPLSKTDADYWRRMYATNMDSTFYLSKAAVELMAPQQSGSIIFITTIGAVRAHHGMLAYDSSKGALNVFTQSLALELAPQGLRVNAVAPGATNRDAHGDEIEAGALAQPHVPWGRRGTPAEIAAAVAFLASAQASYVTGQILCVDGGATAQLSPRGVFI
ncbi:MAG: SDR family oxidoreductase [Armatimonadetes bacterium]|nr:SDR family oxidoreductase [Armatimonadota bacterium]